MNFTKEQLLSGDGNAFARLLCCRFVTAAQAVDAEPSSLVTIDGLAPLLAGLVEQRIAVDWGKDGWRSLVSAAMALQPGLSLASQAYLRFCHTLLLPCVQHAQLDAALQDGMLQLRQRLLLEALADGNFWLKKQPLIVLVDLLQQGLLGWQPGFGQHSDKLLQPFDDSLAALGRIAVGDSKAIALLLNDCKLALADIQGRLDRFASRMKDSETGKIKNRAAQLAASQFVNTVTAGRLLPATVTAFVQQTLVHELHLLLVRQGLDSAIWQQAKTLLSQLVSAYQPDGELQPLDKDCLHALPGQLQDFCYQHIQRSPSVDDFINTVAYDLSQRAAGSIDNPLQPVTPLPVLDELQDVERQVSSQLLNNSRRYREGQWFLMKDDSGATSRCRLLLDLPAYNQRLFANFVGQRCLATSFEDFACLLSARHVQPLSMQGIASRCLHHGLDNLLDNIDEASAQWQQQCEAIRRQRQQERQAIERQAAADKARAEAEALAKRKAEAEKQQQLQQMADDMRRQARLALDSMSLGSWVEIRQADDSFRRAKLAVKFAATGRFVFVDEDGMTLADCQRDELVENLLQGSMKMLESDRKFAERLAKIVGTIRDSGTHHAG